MSLKRIIFIAIMVIVFFFGCNKHLSSVFLKKEKKIILNLPKNHNIKMFDYTFIIGNKAGLIDKNNLC